MARARSASSQRSGRATSASSSARRARRPARSRYTSASERRLRSEDRSSLNSRTQRTFGAATSSRGPGELAAEAPPRWRSSPMAELVLLAAPAPAGLVAAQLVLGPLDHGGLGGELVRAPHPVGPAHAGSPARELVRPRGLGRLEGLGRLGRLGRLDDGRALHGVVL